jgi:hypothetical protein
VRPLSQTHDDREGPASHINITERRLLSMPAKDRHRQESVGGEMITRERLAELRREWEHYELGPADITIQDVFSTIEYLLTVAEKAREYLDGVHGCRHVIDGIDVKDICGQAVKLRIALAALEEK